jgi:hypothetical protein
LRFLLLLLQSLESLKNPGASGFSAVILHYKGDMEAYRDLGILNYASGQDTCCWPPA